MKKKLLWTFLLLLLLGTGLMLFGIIIPVYFDSCEAVLTGPMTMEQQDSGWMLSWPESQEADRYCVEITTASREVLFRDYTEDQPSLMLPPLPENEVLSIQVTPGERFWTLLGTDYHYSDAVLTASVQTSFPQAQVQQLFINGDDKTVQVQLMEEAGLCWQYRLYDGAQNLLLEQILTEPELKLQFGQTPELPLPQEGESYCLKMRAFRETPELVLYGLPCEELEIPEVSLRFRQLAPRLETVSKNTVLLTWEETRGEGYWVQVRNTDADDWTTVSQVAQGAPRSYLDILQPGQTKQYRVVSMDAVGAPIQESPMLTASGRDRVQYATVWPVRDLPAYSSAALDSVVDTVRTGEAYCVLEEKNGMFAVQVRDRICYINSSYCMINLPEYIGGLCNYNITNSVYSIYAIHEFPISKVTGVVTLGYEDICQSDGSYLVPLLYPVAKKLLNAAQNAWDQGFRLKIYDSFRPHAATLEIYDLTTQIMGDPVPDKTYTGLPRDAMELPQPRTGWDYLSLGWLMTGPNFAQNSFLAKGGSAHNLGIALDLTLEKRDTGEELQMQSSMHDLSQYSVLSLNNEAAKLLGDYMHSAGFAGLISEWWHFQDNTTRDSLDLPYVSGGVNAECWVKDDTGWRYREKKGDFLRDQTVRIQGTEYTFDADGYVIA